MSAEKILDISWGSIFKIAIAFIFFYFLFLLKDVLVWIVFALIISVLFNPAINFLKNKGIPRSLAVALIYIFVFGIFSFAIYAIADRAINELQQFTEVISEYFEIISPALAGFGIEANLEMFTLSAENWLKEASGSILLALGAIFGGIFATLTIFTIAIFISLEERGVERVVALFTPKKYEAFVLTLWERTQRKVSGWFGVRILASLFIGLLTFVALYVLKVDYPVSLAFFAGITNFIPIVGPLVAGCVIAILVFLDSWLKALFVVLAFIIIQQVESILVPLLSKKFVGMPPALILIALIMGGTLWGILGAVLAIPIFGILFEFLRDFFKKKKEAEAVVL